MIRLLASLLILALLAGCATSPTPSPRPGNSAPEIVSVSEYRQFLTELRESLDKGVPRKLNEREKERYQRLDRQLDGILAGIDDVDDLDHQGKMELFNLNQELWTTVVGRDEERVICRRHKTVGTNFTQTRCRTVSEIREEQRETDMWMRRGTLRSPPLPEGG